MYSRLGSRFGEEKCEITKRHDTTIYRNDKSYSNWENSTKRSGDILQTDLFLVVLCRT